MFEIGKILETFIKKFLDSKIFFSEKVLKKFKKEFRTGVRQNRKGGRFRRQIRGEFLGAPDSW